MSSYTCFLEMLSLFSSKTVAASANTVKGKDYEVVQPPDDTVSAMAFSPAAVKQHFLVAGSWDNSVSIINVA